MSFLEKTITFWNLIHLTLPARPPPDPKPPPPTTNLDANLHWRRQTFFLKMYIYAWGLTTGSVRNTSEMRKM